MEVNEKTIKTLKKINLDLTQYFVLYCLHYETNWYITLGEDRMSTLNYLKRRGFITADLTTTCKADDLFAGNEIKVESRTKILNKEARKEKYSEWFAEFWNSFPTSDQYKHFPKTRTLRSNKLRAYKLYIEILEEGEYTHEQLLSSLHVDIALKERSSIVQNQFRFLQNICTWLSKRIFEGFVEDLEIIEVNKTAERYGEDVN